MLTITTSIDLPLCSRVTLFDAAVESCSLIPNMVIVKNAKVHALGSL